MQTVDLLKNLTSCIGVSGAENNIVDLLCDILKQYGEVSVDCMNNVYCTFGSGYHFLLDAHLDEIGFVVKDITDDGFIKISNVGGIDRRMLLASEVSVWGDREYRGVISTLPPHLQSVDDEKKAPKIDDISIDVGLTKKEIANHIELGDRVTFKRNFASLLNNQIASNALDDRAGVASIILALDHLKSIDAKFTIMFSSQEEVGTRGAKIGPYNRNVDEAIVVDVSFGYTPMCKRSECGEIGKGPMIGFSPILDKEISNSIVSIAKKYDIPYQIEVMGGGRTGTNADVISISDCGIKTSLLSIPQKYMHSPIEIIDVADVENVSKLIVAYAKERIGEINA